MVFKLQSMYKQELSWEVVEIPKGSVRFCLLKTSQVNAMRFCS
uniref:Uncharacterized protein n=1 Tax=Arundo donax TaxID=35708 RepID=A0A0A9HQS6_ARUDO